jgi:NAD(P)-dependent dehydrogenase (short-subunit alcohol dehydrogenase family)
MKPQLKKLRDQVIVITGASSGIGLATARLAARRGARVVLAARNEEALKSDVEAIRRDGGRAIYVVADVSSPSDCDGIAQAAVSAFGGIDTWVNDAAVAIYGRLDEVHLEEKRRLFEVNFWGVVHGCRAALPHLKRRGGGVIVNLGSLLSDRALPLQGMYAASKHAVKAYTDTLRI